MTHERNNSITLEQQIASIRDNIIKGIDSFPIDIISSFNDEKQVYYENQAGYWEKFTYHENGEIETYLDSHIWSVMDNEYTRDAEEMKKLCSIPTMVNKPVITSIQNDKELKVYVVKINDIIEEAHYYNATDNEFKSEAEKQNNVYSLREFQDDINNAILNLDKDKMIRFIETTVKS